ncbi:hypothetical protein DF268_39145 [Streptomyces sp. V2]|uniref:Uncharacterized protein n=1 Tax=Streptomyces niveiscabiei TaxID=164115 RepID=A0ABW9HX48_9ACTN|nr:hypothetical protein [Streptomyces sp. V2]PWG08194.1 hypothetical protein DF268_39145 [Streptomyces sp. V2]
MPTHLTATTRVTLFPLEDLSLAYTTYSSDTRGLGDIGLVAVLHDELSTGDELWKLAEQLGGRNSRQDQARWILTQAYRARVVPVGEQPRAAWDAVVGRRYELGALFANHEVLMTGRMRMRLEGSA